jgi:hypothetical protein
MQSTVGLLFAMHVATADAEPMAAQWTDSFVDSVGVNVHWSYNKYGKSDDALYEMLKTKLVEAGFRHIRDGAVDKAYARCTELYNNFGIQTTFITGRREAGGRSPLDPSQIGEELTSLKNGIPLEAVAAIEGPNEYDLFHNDRETDWVGKLQTYQRQLYAQVKADPVLKSKPVLGPSLMRGPDYKAVGDLSDYLNYSNLHPYQLTRHPGTGGWGLHNYGGLTWWLGRARVQAPGKPVQATEAGYRTHAKGVTEAIDAKYTPRMFAEFFRRGISRTFKYELLTIKDSEAYGLLRSDGSEKPSFVATRNLLNFLSDNAWDAKNKAWTTPTFTPGTLDYEIATDAADARHVLLQKSNGDFYLLIWNEVSSFDPETRTEIDNPAVAAALTLKTPVSEATIHTLAADGSMATEPAAILGAPGSQKITLNVPDRLMIVVLSQ